MNFLTKWPCHCLKWRCVFNTQHTYLPMNFLLLLFWIYKIRMRIYRWMHIADIWSTKNIHRAIIRQSLYTFIHLYISVYCYFIFFFLHLFVTISEWCVTCDSSVLYNISFYCYRFFFYFLWSSGKTKLDIEV